MKSLPSSEQILNDLGDKVVASTRGAVSDTRSDFLAYRGAHPDWVAQASKRGLANWIHDRLWHHLTVRLDGLPNVSMVDKEPTREIWVGHNYCVRAKRHHTDGAVSTFRTPTAALFLAQPVQMTIDGLDEVHLIVGYEWDRDTNEIGPAVLSLRDDDVLIFVEELPGPDTGGTATGGTTSPLPPTEPTPPVVTDLNADEDKAKESDPE